MPRDTEFLFPSGGSVVQNLNRALYGRQFDWAFLLAPDHRFGAGLLNQLLAHGAPIVVPLCVKRSAPYPLVIGRETTTRDEKTGREYPAYVALGLGDTPSSPFTVEVAGNAGALIRREVFDALGYPYFESTDGLYVNEDVTFSLRARAAGFDILVDPDARLAHITHVPVWPIG